MVVVVVVIELVERVDTNISTPLVGFVKKNDMFDLLFIYKFSTGKYRKKY